MARSYSEFANTIPNSPLPSGNSSLRPMPIRRLTRHFSVSRAYANNSVLPLDEKDD